MSIEKSCRLALVSYIEGHTLNVPETVTEENTDEPRTNYGMGEITTAPPEEAAQ